MGSPQAGLRDVAAVAEMPQYQHFIPRLILRGFSQDVGVTSKTSSNKKGDKSKKVKKDGELHFISTQNGKLGSSLLSRHYGLTDMYRDVDAVDQQHLEKGLARLEARAGELLAQARRIFSEPGASFTITRPDKDILRKFLFLMKYRNSAFFSRFNVATIDEYAADDREKIEKYMRSRSFQSPKQVWLANIRAFLDVEMDAEREWKTKIQRCAYPDDAMLFILHVEQSYMAFCRPRSVDDEFLLTENVFGIFEGPNSLKMNPATGGLARGVWTEWHNFAPMSSSLLIILRSNYLPGNVIGPTDNRDKIYRALLAMHPCPERAVSMLQDLPIRRCTTSYSTVQNNRVSMNSNYTGPSRKDCYTFDCFELDTAEVDRINSIFLEEAMSATSIVYKSRAATARSIRSYLEDPRPGFKVLYGNDLAKQNYLNALETALKVLGGAAKTFSTTVSPLSVEPHPLDYAGHMARWVAFVTAVEIFDQHPKLMDCYRLLGGESRAAQQYDVFGYRDDTTTTRSDTIKLRWYEDAEQAGKIAFFHIKIDSALSNTTFTSDEKRRCRWERHKFFATLCPRTIWLYTKVVRNLRSFNIDDFIQQIEPLQCAGPEDEAVRRESMRKMRRLVGD